MGVFSSNLDTEVRIEKMRPRQTREAIDKNPVIYVPFYGIVGIDPRKHASAETGMRETNNLIDYLEKWLAQ